MCRALSVENENVVLGIMISPVWCQHVFFFSLNGKLYIKAKTIHNLDEQSPQKNYHVQWCSQPKNREEKKSAGIFMENKNDF